MRASRSTSWCNAPHYFAVVDEVDNILIDEARTPLIISGFPTDSFQEAYLKCAKAAPHLENGQDKEDEDYDYWVDEKGHNILLTERGQDRGEAAARTSPISSDLHFNYHHHFGASSQSKRAVQAGRKLCNQAERRRQDGSRHRRRIHRSYDAGTPLERRFAPGCLKRRKVFRFRKKPSPTHRLRIKIFSVSIQNFPV